MKARIAVFAACLIGIVILAPGAQAKGIPVFDVSGRDLSRTVRLSPQRVLDALRRDDENFVSGPTRAPLPPFGPGYHLEEFLAFRRDRGPDRAPGPWERQPSGTLTYYPVSGRARTSDGHWIEFAPVLRNLLDDSIRSAGGEIPSSSRVWWLFLPLPALAAAFGIGLALHRRPHRSFVTSVVGLLCLAACSPSTSTSEKFGPVGEGVVQLVASNVELNPGEAVAFGFHPTAAKATVSWTGSGRVVVCPDDPTDQRMFGELGPGGGWGRVWPRCISRSGSGHLQLPTADGNYHYAFFVGARRGKVVLDHVALTYASVDEYGALGVVARPRGAAAPQLWVRSPSKSSHRVGVSDINAQAGQDFRIEVRRNDSVIASFDGRGSVAQPQLRVAKGIDTAQRPLSLPDDTIVAFSKSGRQEPLVVYFVLGFVHDARKMRHDADRSPQWSLPISSIRATAANHHTFKPVELAVNKEFGASELTKIKAIV